MMPVAESTRLETMDIADSEGDLANMITDQVINDTTDANVSTDYPSYNVPVPIQEESLENVAPRDVPIDDQPINYEVIERSSQRGQIKLADSVGYTYTVKKRWASGYVTWRCSVRNYRTKIVCSATIRQSDNDFVPGGQPHIHQPAAGAGLATKVQRDVKERAAADLISSAARIVDDVLIDRLDEAPAPAVPKPVNLARQANRRRQKDRPIEPTNLDFIVNEEHIEPDDWVRMCREVTKTRLW